MKFHWRTIISLVLFIPFFYRIKYIFGAWQYSPLDQKDYVFWIIALVISALFLLWARRNAAQLEVKTDYYGLLLLAAALVVIVFSLIKDINTVYLGGSLLFIAGGCWLLWGWRVLWTLCPVFFIAALGLPSTSYWTSFLLNDWIQNVSGFGIKLILAILALVWFMICLWRPRKSCIQPEPFFFWFVIAAFAIAYVQSSKPETRGAPVCLALEPAAGGWLGEQLKLSPLDDTFQGQNKISRYVHYSRANICVDTLAIELCKDLHQIHPTALCLATGGWKILSNRQVRVGTRLGELSASQIIAVKNNRRAMFYAWFTSDAFSTGSFISFRKEWNYNETWYIYQVTTPVLDNDADTEKILIDFINAFASRDEK